MQQRPGNAVATSIVPFLILVVVFALFDPFHDSGLWVYGMSAVATGFCVAKMNEPTKKPAPKKPPDLAAAFRAGEESAVTKKRPASVAPRVNPRLARAQRVWAMERDRHRAVVDLRLRPPSVPASHHQEVRGVHHPRGSGRARKARAVRSEQGHGSRSRTCTRSSAQAQEAHQDQAVHRSRQHHATRGTSGLGGRSYRPCAPKRSHGLAV